MEDLVGKVALITGSASGIGLGIARACLAAGMKVVISDIDEAELESAVAVRGGVIERHEHLMRGFDRATAFLG
jgi:NAD(P)-dependent dehydrogenase (short-subunit alcohol dehydrogenase family)